MDHKDIERIAALSRVKLSEEEKELFLMDLDSFAGFAEELSGLDPDKIPAYSDRVSVSFMREDSVRNTYTREEMLKNSPALSKDGSMISVPKVL